MDDDSECQLNNLVQSFYKTNPMNSKITIKFKSSSLKRYHGLTADQAMSTKKMIDTDGETLVPAPSQ